MKDKFISIIIVVLFNSFCFGEILTVTSTTEPIKMNRVLTITSEITQDEFPGILISSYTYSYVINKLIEQRNTLDKKILNLNKHIDILNIRLNSILQDIEKVEEAANAGLLEE